MPQDRTPEELAADIVEEYNIQERGKLRSAFAIAGATVMGLVDTLLLPAGEEEP